MKRALEKFAASRALSIVYFGGSITDGVGASEPEKTSWRALTTEWFRAKFRDAEIRAHNASMRGAGSQLGAFRVAEHVLSHRPDLVFVEFAVNDWRLDAETILRSLEGIVRALRRAEPPPEIVFVYATMRRLAELHPGRVPPSVCAHQCIAAHYGISEVSAGAALLRAVESGAQTWEQLTTDGVHPTDAGHALYATEVTRALEPRLLSQSEDSRDLTLPAPLTNDPIEHGTMLSAAAFGDAPGWSRETNQTGGFFKNWIVCDKPGVELVIPFRGTAAGLVWMVAPDSGDIAWSLDGGKPRRASSWDSYALRFSRVHFCVFADALPDGAHTLRLRVLEEKNAHSSGHSIRIGALLSNQPPAKSIAPTLAGNATC